MSLMTLGLIWVSPQPSATRVFAFRLAVQFGSVQFPPKFRRIIRRLGKFFASHRDSMEPLQHSHDGIFVAAWKAKDAALHKKASCFPNWTEQRTSSRKCKNSIITLFFHWRKKVKLSRISAKVESLFSARFGRTSEKECCETFYW